MLRTVGLAAIMAARLTSPGAAAQTDPSAAVAEAGAPAGIEAQEPATELMSEDELWVFRQLEGDEVRQAFLDRFWAEREETVRDLWLERSELARTRFESVSTDRARTLLFSGPPQFIVTDVCPQPIAALEVWHYREPEGGPENQPGDTTAVFLADGAGYRLWHHDWAAIAPGEADSEAAARDMLRTTCPRAKELISALEAARDADAIRGGFASAPAADPAWVDQFLAQTPILPRHARALLARTKVSFPAGLGEQTVVLLTVDVPGAEVRAVEPTGFALTGTVRTPTELVDHFRYRFERALSGDEALRLEARRHLPPGRYRLDLKLHVLGTDAYYRDRIEIEVPAAAAADWAGPGDRLFRLLPPPDILLVGRQRFEAAVTGDDVAKVAFLLNGRRAMTKARPPFSVELDLGDVPRPQTLEAVAYASDGQQLARDALALNAGPHRFSTRIVAPAHGERLDRLSTVHAEVDLPPGERLAYLDLFWNEDRIARLHQGPFVQSFELPDDGDSSYLRAVAVLADGNSAEDLVVVNTGDTTEAIEVDFVELYAGIQDGRGRPIEDLRLEDFEVLEDGLPQRLLRLETVDNLPINAAVVLDTSTSMEEEIEQVERAAAEFFERVIQPKDRAAVVVFSDVAQLRVPLTNDLDELRAGLSGIEPEGYTSLYDSVIYGLYYLTGLSGKRALILISDGEDSRSDFDFDETLDFARRSGIAVYTIGLGIPSDNLEERAVLRRLAHETGGEAFQIETARRMERIYERIEDALRSQYLLGYQSSQSEPGRFRTIQVRLRGREATVRAAPGYYP